MHRVCLSAPNIHRDEASFATRANGSERQGKVIQARALPKNNLRDRIRLDGLGGHNFVVFASASRNR